MADEPTTTDATAASTAAETDPDSGAEATATAAGAADDIPRDDKGNIVPTPGDVRTEPVSTAAQSHVAGRVGPPTVAQDATATYHTPVAVAQIEPGEEADAATPMLGGPLPPSDPPAVVAARAIDEGPGDEPVAGSGTKTTSTASGPSGSPTLPTGGPASSTSPGSAGGTEAADSGSGGPATGSAGSSEASESGGPAGSSK